MKTRLNFLTILILTIFTGLSCKKETPVSTGIIQLASCTIGSVQLGNPDKTTGITNDADIIITFSSAIDTNSAKKNILLRGTDNTSVQLVFSFSENNSVVTLNPADPLDNLTDYKLSITSALKGGAGETFAGTIRSRRLYPSCSSGLLRTTGLAQATRQ